MQFNPVAVAPSDVPLPASIANGFAILSQLLHAASRRLTGCWAARIVAHLHRSTAVLRIIGDDLDPTEITEALNCEPTRSQQKGEVFTNSNGRSRTAKFGMWLLEASAREPDGQVAQLLERLNPSLDIWQSIATRYRMEMFSGLFMQESNEGAALSSASMVALGQRGIELSLDIYSPIIEDLQAQQIYWRVRSTLELIAELIGQHGELQSELASLNMEDEEALWCYLVSNQLWGGPGSVADQALIQFPDSRKKLEQLMIKLGQEQMKVSQVNARTEMWVAAFEKLQ